MNLPLSSTNTSPNPTNTEVVFGFFIDLFFLCLFLFAVRRFAPDWFTVHRFLRACFENGIFYFNVIVQRRYLV